MDTLSTRSALHSFCHRPEENCRCEVRMKYIKVPVPEAKRFVVDCLKAVGANDRAAKQQADMLIMADMSRHQSHGIQRLDCYVSDVQRKICQPNNTPKIIKETVSTAWVDACNCFGSTVSEYAVEVAMTKAKATGVGWISIKGANHNGMIGYYAKMCALKGFIGLYFTNTSPLLVPTRAKKAVLGTNPLALVAPAGNGEFFHFEMATTGTAFGQIELRQKQGLQIPLGLALDIHGHKTTDPNKAIEARLLMPLGGGEETSGYKGYGLAAMVEVLCGICAGSNYGHHIRSLGLANYDAPANLGHCCIAVNPDCFAPGFSKRLLAIMTDWRNLEPVDPKFPVEAPGDMEKRALEEVKKNGGIMYLQNEIEHLKHLAKQLKVQSMRCSN